MATRETVTEKLAEVEAAIDPIKRVDQFGMPALAILVASIVGNIRFSDVLEGAARHTGGLASGKELRAAIQVKERIELLEKLAPMDLLKLALEALLREELYEAAQTGDATRTHRVDRFLAGSRSEDRTAVSPA